MKIYWSKKDIPGLQGLSQAERMTALQSVMGRVWSHWQVWGSILGQIVFFLLLLYFLPQFPLRLLVVLGASFAVLMLTKIPFHHYIAHYLEEDRKKRE